MGVWVDRSTLPLTFLLQPSLAPFYEGWFRPRHPELSLQNTLWHSGIQSMPLYWPFRSTCLQKRQPDQGRTSWLSNFVFIHIFWKLRILILCSCRFSGHLWKLIVGNGDAGFEFHVWIKKKYLDWPEYPGFWLFKTVFWPNSATFFFPEKGIHWTNLIQFNTIRLFLETSCYRVV